MQKIYKGTTADGMCAVTVTDGAKATTELAPDLAYPYPFAWGRVRPGGPGTPGSTYLAIRLLVDATGCSCRYNYFRHRWVMELEPNWESDDEEIRDLVATIRKRAGHQAQCELMKFRGAFRV